MLSFINLVLKDLLKLYEKGDLILNKNAIERLGVYLDKEAVLEAAGQGNNRKNKKSAETIKRNTR